MNKKKIILPIFVVLLAVAVTIVLVKSRKMPQPQETPHQGPLVEVTELVETTRDVVVRSTGTVQPRREVSITPQVRGKIVEISPRMVAGGVFRQGELLFAIEDVDYRLAIELARASLAQAALELMRIENLADVARREWAALNPESDAVPNPMVVYEPQLKSATAARDAALASLKQAEINLQRTRIVAPFNCYVRSEKIEIGQFVNAGTPVATVAGVDQVEVVVPLPLDELTWLSVPRTPADEAGSRAIVELHIGGEIHSWPGAVTRALSDIDPRNRMASLVITVAEPHVGDGTAPSLIEELLPGMFVQVKIYGATVDDLFAVPRAALHDNDTVWIVDEDNRLRMRSVELLRREREEVLLRSGIEPGERLILTNLSAAAEGMLLRPQQQEAGQ